MMPDTPDLAAQHASATLNGRLPFDGEHLDELLESAGLDAVMITSKHNIQYLLGGYRFFFDHFDAIGITRYLPMLIYRKGHTGDAVYIGNAMEDSEVDNGRFWCGTVETRSWGTLDAVEVALGHLRRLGLEAARLSGLPVTRSLVLVYAISGFLAGLAGLMLAAQLGQGSSLVARGAELDSIAAAVVGGASLFGGVGSPLAAVLGGLLIGAISNVLDLQGIAAEPQLIMKGALIVFAVYLTSGRGAQLRARLQRFITSDGKRRAIA